MIFRDTFSRYERDISDVMDCESYFEKGKMELKNAIIISKKIKAVDNLDYDVAIALTEIKDLNYMVDIFLDELYRDMPEYAI